MCLRNNDVLGTLTPVDRLAATMLVAMIVSSCSSPPVRPNSVPEGATVFSFNWEPAWVYCWLDAAANVDRCHFWDSDGRLILPSTDLVDPSDDIFVPFQNGPTVGTPDLVIDPQNMGIDFVSLRNGIYLVRPRDRARLAPWLNEQIRLRAERDGRAVEWGGPRPRTGVTPTRPP